MKAAYRRVRSDSVFGIEPGAIVSCQLALGYASHTGIYVGQNCIVHLDGDGIVEMVTPERFLARFSGKNTARSIYVSASNGKVLVWPDAVQIALERIGDRYDYNPLTNNCHMFVLECLADSEQLAVWNRAQLFSALKLNLKQMEWLRWEWQKETYE